MIIKICGIQTKETLLCCEKNKIDFFGMIFYKKSPRNISKENAKYLLNLSRNLNIEGVGVFVNENINTLKELVFDLKLNIIQLHGEEDNDYIKKLKDNKLKIIKKISIKYQNDLNKINNYSDADYYLFDYMPNPGELPGGNAKSFNWNILNNFQIIKPWFISGGINIDNIDLLRKKINPFGVDLSSGVEKELGIKDNHIINNLMDKIKYA
tara:strand:- start:115 stop:744 length:630 start_codon:yes stop_codon:yes gene_type:complete